jgi:1,4-dihydroxy-2-naphthoate octaprenyltransferase
VSIIIRTCNPDRQHLFGRNALIEEGNQTTGSDPGSLPIWRVWWIASRPKTLSAAIAPVLVGSAVAIAEDGFRPLPAVAALLVGILIQVGTNIYNDYADFNRGADTSERLGPLRVTQAGLMPPQIVRRAAILSFVFAGLIGLYLIWIAGWPVALLGLGAILAGLAYTAGPWPLAYNGLGDLFAWIFFGFVAVGGTAYVQLQRIPFLAWMGGLAIGAAITALLAVNNIRDIEADRIAGRRTLPVVFGRKAGVIEYGVCLISAYLVPLALVITGNYALWILLPILTLPEAIRLVGLIGRLRGRHLNQGLEGTARLVMGYGLLLAVGIVFA